MNNYHRTAAWLHACGKEPGNVQHLSVQLGVHLEEITELLTCLRVDSSGWQRLLERVVTDLADLGTELKQCKRVAHIPAHLRLQALDALCDCDVTGNGIAYLAAMDKDTADRRVLDSNDSKLQGDGTPVLMVGGKIGKSSQYAPPDLRACV